MKKSRQILLLISLLLLIALLFSFTNLWNTLVLHTQIDTIGHFIGFFLLTWLVTSLVKLPQTVLMFSLIFYAAATEIGQWYLGFRNGEMQDFIADTLAICTFMLIRWTITICRSN